MLEKSVSSDISSVTSKVSLAALPTSPTAVYQQLQSNRALAWSPDQPLVEQCLHLVVLLFQSCLPICYAGFFLHAVAVLVQ